MMRLPTPLLLLLVGFVLCSSFTWSEIDLKKLDPKSYIAWIERPGNGLQSRVRQGEYDFIMSYRPTEYLILKSRQIAEMSRSAMNEHRDEMKGVQYYSLVVALNDGESNLAKHVSRLHFQDSDAAVSYLAFDMKDDIKLIQGADTLDCQFFHLEETFELTPYAKFQLSFEQPNDKKSGAVQSKTIEVDIPWLKDKMLFHFDSKDLKRIPKVLVKN